MKTKRMMRILVMVPMLAAGIANGQQPLKNSGDLRVFTGASVKVFGDFINSGTLTVDAGATMINNGGLTDSGTITSSTGTFVYSPSSVLTYSGSGPQTIGAELPGTNSPGSVIINNTSGVTLGTDATINNLTFSSGNLNLNGKILTIAGAISNTSGSFVGGGEESALVLTGTGGTVSFDQTSAASRTIGSIAVNAPSGTLTLGNKVEVTNTVTLSNGTLASAGNLVLVSAASGTARVAEVTGTGAITGNVTVQRFIPGGKRAWRFLSSAVSGPTFANSWQQSIHITGPGSGGTACPAPSVNANGFDVNSSTTASVHVYSESTGAWTSIANTNNTTLDPTAGYMVYVRGNRTQGCSLINAPFAVPQPVVLEATGTITTGQVHVNLTYTPSGGDGWNLVSNPYPSAIDWNDAAWVSVRDASINPTIYVWNPASGGAGQYASWHPIGGAVNGGAAIIQSGQSFFVKTTATATLTFEEAYKMNDRTTQLMGKTGLENNLRIQLADTGVMDEAVIFTYPGCSFGTDNQDGEKMSDGTGAISTYTTAGNTLLTYNALEPLTVGATDTVFIKSGLVAGKSYRLNFIGLSSFGNQANFFLFDRFTQTLTDLSTTSTYLFSTTSVPSSYYTNRFYLLFTNPSPLPVTLTRFTAKKLGQSALLDWSTSSESNSSHFIVERSFDAVNFTGIARITAAGNSSAVTGYSFLDANPALKHNNYYRLKMVDLQGKYRYSDIRSLNWDGGNEQQGTLQVYPNPATDKLFVIPGMSSQGDYRLKVYNVEGNPVKEWKASIREGRLEISLSGLSRGLYVVIASDDSGNTSTAKVILE